ncbi:MAG: DUF1365 domain-containing protein [Planctomycetes bacterium]|nr:DUF1365 domain-containing protein [Planctomycetota bacterium]
MNSAVYTGWVRHRRYRDKAQWFRHRVFMCCLDLAELPRLFAGRRWWRLEGPGIASFRRSDYLGDPSLPLDTAVRDLVQRRTGVRPSGPIRLLTHLRYLGACFNPVSFYYCYDAAGTQVETVVAEITNTPWLERHSYVLPVQDGRMRWSFAKDFHVSPFLGMDQRYQWAFSAPGEHLGVHMRNCEGGRAVFDASLSLQRRPWSDAVLAGVWYRYPAMSIFALVAIYWHALVLWWRGATFHPHPATRRDLPEAA